MTDADVAIAVVEAGAAVVRNRFGTALERLDKGAGDFATNADIEAENAMLAVLRQERPNDAILGEESGRTGAADTGRTWLIDPLCGTLNYAARMPVVAVNAALQVDNRFLAAAVAEPFSHEVYWTDLNSARMRTGGNNAPLVPESGSRLVDLNLDPPFPSAPAFRATTLAGHPEFVAAFRPRVVSSSIALAWVATGQRAAYVTDGDLSDSVHFAAGLAICEAARCLVTNLQGQPWRASPRGLIAAADAKTHRILLSLINNS